MEDSTTTPECAQTEKSGFHYIQPRIRLQFENSTKHERVGYFRNQNNKGFGLTGLLPGAQANKHHMDQIKQQQKRSNLTSLVDNLSPGIVCLLLLQHVCCQQKKAECLYTCRLHVEYACLLQRETQTVLTFSTTSITNTALLTFILLTKEELSPPGNSCILRPVYRQGGANALICHGNGRCEDAK